jgi:DNA-binding beta-propeller fold protein YncE
VRSSRVLSLVALTATLVGATLTGVAIGQPDGAVGPSVGLYTNGRYLQPMGRMTELGNFPTGGALSPDGRFYWAVDAGHGVNDVKVMDVGTGEVRQTLPLPGAYVGVAFSPDGTRAYVSGQPRGCCGPQGSTLGDDGDVIHVYDVDPATGHASELAPIPIPATTGGSYRLNTLPPDPTANNWPIGLDTTPDGETLLAALGNADRLAIIDPDTGAVEFADVGAYPYDVEADPSRPRAYVSNEYDGTISVLDLPSGDLVKTIGVGGQRGDRAAHPEDLLADPTRDRLYAAVTSRDLIAVIDTESLEVVRYIDVGRPEGIGTAPVSLAISPDGHTLYSADSGEDAVAAIALTDRPDETVSPDKSPVVDVRPQKDIERFVRQRERARRQLADALADADGKVERQEARDRYRAKLARLRERFLVGPLTESCSGPSREDETRWVDAVLKARIRFLRTRERAADLPPADRREKIKRAKERYRDAVENARAGLASIGCPPEGFAPGADAFSVVGRLPTASYTTDVEVTPDGGKLVWLAAKGLGAGPNPDFETAPYGEYVPQKLLGRAGVLPLPTDREMQEATEVADTQIVPTNAKPPPEGTPVVGPDGGASEDIKYVFYIVRENRTYDQVFGTDPRGDGDPSLELFDDNGVPGPTGGVTPNAHALARTFPLLDHVYANSEVSIDGHMITAGAYAIDYAQKGLHSSYSDRGKGADVGIAPVSYPPNRFVFDQAAEQGVSFRSYGELGAGNHPFGNDGSPTFLEVIANTDVVYPTNLQQGCDASLPVPNVARCFQDSGIVNGKGEITGIQSRVEVFESEFALQLATGTVPRFNYLILPNDHTSGTAPGIYTPEAMIADNDLALGQIVELISQSPIWKESAIFVVEDDSQDGADHVDAHRMPAFVISPWARRGAAVTTRYDHYSFLRTAMMIVGLRPVSLNDALATPLYDAFISGGEQPDVEGTRYEAIVPEQSLTEVNPPDAPDAELSAALPWDHLDYVPQALSDRILWRSVYGEDSNPPEPGPNASGAEHARAVGALRVYRNAGDVREWILSRPESESETAEQEEELRARVLSMQLGVPLEEAEEIIEEAEGVSEGEAEEEEQPGD